MSIQNIKKFKSIRTYLFITTAFFCYFNSGLLAYAHHPFEASIKPLNISQGFLSGLAHPLLGYDHFLFLFSIGLTAIFTLKRLVPLLLSFGLVGSLVALLGPSLPGGEIIVGLSLVVSACIAFGFLNPYWMVPFAFFHGYVLAGSMIGAEPTPIITYLCGLLISESLVIFLGLILLRRFLDIKKNLAFALMGVGVITTFSTILN